MRHERLRSRFALGLLLLAQTSAAFAAARRPNTPPVQLVPPLDGPEVNTLGVERDGTRRLVAFGMRVLSRPDGAVDVANEIFPLPRNVQVVELPPRFGSGFLFSAAASGRTSIWKATSFTGKLEPFAELDFDLERLVPGFDRIHMQARRTGDWAALDAATGKGLDRGSLPAAPSYGAMAFVDEWFGAVELPVRGTLVSFDAGLSWHRLGFPTLAIGNTASELVFATPNGRQGLGPDGNLHALDGPSPAATEADAALRRVSPEGPLGRLPLRLAVLRGFAESRETAVVLAQGALGRVRLADGALLEARERVASVSSQCSAVRLGKSFGFVCGETRGKTLVFAFEPPLGVRLVESFDHPRAVAASGNGALVIRGSCAADAPDTRGLHCIRDANGSAWQVRVPGDSGVERVVALADGRAAVLAPPRLGNAGALSIADAKGGATRTKLRIETRDAAARSLLTKGFWLDGMVQTADGSLAGWVSGHGLFAGVRVKLDGQVEVGRLQRRVERALFSGERALVIPDLGMEVGTAEQSVDGGKTWTDVDLPAGAEPDAKTPASNLALEQGCSTVGCGFLGWLRVGWDNRRGGARLVMAPSPKPTALPSPGGGRWLLNCAPTGEASRGVARSRTAKPEAAPNEERPPWPPLFERAPPPLPRDAVGFHTGNDGEMRAYAWAPRGAEFGKTGKLSVAVVDRYRLRDAVWSTLQTPSPWSDVTHVAETFGYEGLNPSSWNLVLDPSGRAGILSITARASTDLYALEEDRAVAFLTNASRQGIGALSSAVRLGTTYYVAGHEDPRTIRVFALETGQVRLVGQYADVATSRELAPTLVRSTRGDALAIWARGAGWFVYPIDARTGVASRAIEIPASELSRLPRSCAPDEEGYLLEGPLGIDPYAEFAGGAERVSARAFEGRFVVTERGICVSELIAQAAAPLDPTLRPSSATPAPQKTSVPLVLSDRADGGRRWAFRCGR